MTGRQFRRCARRHPIAAAVVVLIGLVLVVSIAAHLAGLILLAAVGAGGYALGRNRRPVVRASSPSLKAERDQLGAEVADLRRQLADALASAEAAWDAAAERPPAVHAEPGDTGGERAALLADPLGGARPLISSMTCAPGVRRTATVNRENEHYAREGR